MCKHTQLVKHRFWVSNPYLYICKATTKPAKPSPKPRDIFWMMSDCYFWRLPACRGVGGHPCVTFKWEWSIGKGVFWVRLEDLPGNIHLITFSLPEAQEVSPLCSGTAAIAFYIPSLKSPPLIIKTPQGTKKTAFLCFKESENTSLKLRKINMLMLSSIKNKIGIED